MSGTRIESAGPCDLAILAELSRLSFATDDAASFAGTPWSARSLAEVMALPGVFALVALSNGVPAGFVLVQVALDTAELLTLGVAPPARRAGHGARLLQAAMDEAVRRGAARMTLEVAEYNRNAQMLYRKAGFVPVGRRRNYYRTRGGAAADAVILAHSLAAAPGADALA